MKSVDPSLLAPAPPESPEDPSGEGRSSAGNVLRSAAVSPAGIAVLFVGGVLAVDAGGTDDGPGLCAFRHVTGGYCPGCGLTRGARHLVHGELAAAWADHPWIVLAVAQAAVILVVAGVARHRTRAIDWSRWISILAVVNFAALVSIWAIRLADGSIPRFF